MVTKTEDKCRVYSKRSRPFSREMLIITFPTGFFHFMISSLQPTYRNLIQTKWSEISKITSAHVGDWLNVYKYQAQKSPHQIKFDHQGLRIIKGSRIIKGWSSRVEVPPWDLNPSPIIVFQDLTQQGPQVMVESNKGVDACAPIFSLVQCLVMDMGPMRWLVVG